MNENKITDNSASDNTKSTEAKTITVSNGKGDSPRNNLSNTFREHYDEIAWDNKVKDLNNKVSEDKNTRTELLSYLDQKYNKTVTPISPINTIIPKLKKR